MQFNPVHRLKELAVAYVSASRRYWTSSDAARYLILEDLKYYRFKFFQLKRRLKNDSKTQGQTGSGDN